MLTYFTLNDKNLKLSIAKISTQKAQSFSTFAEKVLNGRPGLPDPFDVREML